ncbi:hypothetical protein D3C77_686420 [compost metagenome]
MPAAMRSKRPARRPGISEPHSVSTGLMVSICMRSKTLRTISGDSPVTLPSRAV